MTNHVAGAARANEEERERAKGQTFSTEEDETLRKARTQPGWTWKGIASQLPGRSEQVAHDRWRLLLQRGQAEVAPPSIKRWSAQEDATLRKARGQPGWTWKEIASQLPGRSEQAAITRWQLLQRGQAEVAPPPSKRWSAQEDATLRKACGEPGLTWEGITLQLPGRSEQAAVERWRLLQDQQAAPRQRSSWSAQEDDTLRKARTQPGWTWNGIASQLPGKSEFAAKYRWQLLQRGQSEVAPPSSRDWSAQEDATLSKARRQPGWTWEGITSQLPGRTVRAARGRWKHLQRGQSEVAPPHCRTSTWSAQEDATLSKARRQPGWTWKEITLQLPGRSESAASTRWQFLQRGQSEVVMPHYRTWSAQEDATLRKARAEPGWTWEGIASQIPGRTEKTAYDRWRYLQRGQSEVAPPSSKSWSAQEDATLLNGREQQGWTWKEITSQLPGRSEGAATERWRLLQRRQSEVALSSSKRWSAQEDATLLNAREQPGWTWKGITSQLPGRSKGAAQERWRLLQRGQSEVAPPSSTRWSSQEDATLLNAREQPGWTWKGIASQLPGRSELAARDRWARLQQQDAQVGEDGSTC